MRVEVSKAAPGDQERLIDIFSDPDLKTNGEESRWFVRCYLEYHHIIVARVDGEIQGACFWRVEGERYCGLGWIENLWVEERYRRLGLAEKLLRRSAEDIRTYYEENGVKARKVILTTQVERSNARRLYEKVGFRCSAELEDLYGPGEPDLLYVLDL